MNIYPKYQIRMSAELIAKARALGPARIRQLIESDYEKTRPGTTPDQLLQQSKTRQVRTSGKG